jgi:hypothetical protein
MHLISNVHRVISEINITNIVKLQVTVDGSIKQGGLCGGRGRCMGVGGKRVVEVWDNFECAARARLCL